MSELREEEGKNGTDMEKLSLFFFIINLQGK